MAAKKAPKEKKPVTFDLLGDTTFASRTKEALMKAKKTGTTVDSLTSVRRELIRIPPIFFQATVNSYGFQTKTLVDIIGGEGIGKTTLMFMIAGWGMSVGSPFFYVETEGKVIDEDRACRALNTDKTLAKKMFDRIAFDQCFELGQAIESIDAWVRLVRDPKSDCYVPHHIPVIVGLDTFSKLMSASEATGRQLYTDHSLKGEAGKAKALGTGSNFGHAKIAQAWSRQLPNWLTMNNVLLILNRHQNDKVEMNAKPGGSTMTPEQGAGFNTTSIGGRAFSQNAALQLILSRFKFASKTVKHGETTETIKLGVDCKITVSKNSYGPNGPVCFYRINQLMDQDTDTTYQPAITFAPYTPDWLRGKGIFEITSKNKNCFSCRELSLFDVTAEEFADKLQANEEALNTIGTRLRLKGYEIDDTAPLPLPVVADVAVETEPTPDSEEIPTTPQDE